VLIPIDPLVVSEPVKLTAFVLLLNVKLPEPLKAPASLNWMVVFAPPGVPPPPPPFKANEAVRA